MQLHSTAFNCIHNLYSPHLVDPPPRHKLGKHPRLRALARRCLRLVYEDVPARSAVPIVPALVPASRADSTADPGRGDRGFDARFADARVASTGLGFGPAQTRRDPGANRGLPSLPSTSM
jgi:hypothetical protein